MKLEGRVLHLDKKLSSLDRKVLDFARRLEEAGIDYVIVSGYVAILTGRSRGTEDIDLLIDPGTFDEEKFSGLLDRGYWTVDATQEEDVEERLEDDLSVRVAEEEEVIPNFEIFYPTTRWDERSLENRVEADFKDGDKLFISPLELQIAYKLYLGAEKDFEDALHLFTVFKESLEHGKLEKLSKEMDVHEQLQRLRET